MNNSDLPYIVIDQLNHSYEDGKIVLNDISLDIGAGIFGLLGANGAGKTTLMRIICTLVKPVKGSITIGGYDVIKDSLQVRQLLGYLPQNFDLWGMQKVADVLDIMAILSGVTDKAQRAYRVDQLLNSVGLSELAKRKVKNLSGGMLRRLGVAQALVHDPKVLIMDEPTVGLDPEERLRFRQMMSDLSHDKIIILSTHIIADLGSSCSDIALINSGTLKFRGLPKQLIQQAHGKVFEVSGSDNFLEELDHNSGFEIVSQFYRDGKRVLRGVSNKLSLVQAQAVSDITLEEAYLAYTRSA